MIGSKPRQSTPPQGKRFDRFMTHKWWIGVSGVVAVVGVGLPYLTHGDKATLDYTSAGTTSTAPHVASTENHAVGSCNAQGSGNSVTCIQPQPSPSVDGLKHLSMSSRRTEATVGEFWLPPDTDFTNFPPGDGGGLCSEDEFQWLQKRGKEVTSTYQVNLRNSATAGAMVNLTDLRIENFASKEASRGIWFDCANAGSDDYVTAELDLDHDGRVTIRNGSSSDVQPGSMFSFSLQPGEGGVLLVIPTGHRQSTSGRLVATAQYGDGLKVITIPFADGEDSFAFPGRGDRANLIVSPGGGDEGPFECQNGPDGDIKGCTAPEIRSWTASHWRS